MRNAVRDALSGAFPCCLFWTAARGEEAIEKTNSFRPDAVLMDVGLPGINGIEATPRIKVTYPDTKVIVWTLRDDPAMREQAIAGGADTFLLKSDEPEGLLRSVRDLLGQQSRGSRAKRPGTITHAGARDSMSATT
jgi:DNA-binding NarL/FixJ family response regulator